MDSTGPIRSEQAESAQKLFERVKLLMATGLLGRERKRHNPHSRMYTKNYADQRQRLKTHFVVGSHFVKPQPSSHARRRAALRARTRFFDRLKVGGAVRAAHH